LQAPLVVPHVTEFSSRVFQYGDTAMQLAATADGVWLCS